MKIGAVVLSYNKAWIFEQFWRSLEGQTREPDKIVVVDDGSQDGAYDLATRLCLVSTKAFLCQTPRVGQSAARNFGLSLLRDMDLVIFLDGDLYLSVHMLGRMEQELADFPGVHFVYCHYDRTGAISGKVAAKPWDLNELKRGNYVSPMSLVRRKDLPQPCFDEEMERYEDWDLWLRMGKAGKVGQLIDETLFTAYYREGDLSANGESQGHFFGLKSKHGII